MCTQIDVKPHTVRFWQSKFNVFHPIRRSSNGRQYYRLTDLNTLKQLKYLIYEQGMTIRGVQKMLAEQGKTSLFNNPLPTPDNSLNTMHTATEQPSLFVLPTQQSKPAPLQTQTVNAIEHMGFLSVLLDMETRLTQAMPSLSCYNKAQQIVLTDAYHRLMYLYSRIKDNNKQTTQTAGHL